MNWRSVRFLFFFFSPGFLSVLVHTSSSELLDTSHINPSSPIILHVLLSFFAPFLSLLFLLASISFLCIPHYLCPIFASKP